MCTDIEAGKIYTRSLKPHDIIWAWSITVVSSTSMTRGGLLFRKGL